MTYTYLPEPLGGTELYVRSLVDELRKLGLQGAIAAPGARNEDYQLEGTHIWRVAAALQTDQLYGAENSDASARWVEILTKAQPRILHVHARMPMLHSKVLKAAQVLGVRVLYTVHTPTAFCLRGTMLELGQKVCDGKITLHRCNACMLQKHQVPAAQLISQLPLSTSQALAKLLPSSASKVLSMKSRALRFEQETRAFFAAADQVIPVCNWIADAIAINQFSASVAPVNRQGLRSDFALRTFVNAAPAETASPLRLIAMGRADPTKGFDTLVQAVSKADCLVELDLCLSQCNVEFETQLLRNAKLARVRIHRNVAADALMALMDLSDIVAIPSMWLETGPLVVLEAFARGLPVLGSKRGGIAELVQHNYNGWLVEAGDASAWRAHIEHLARHRVEIADAKARIASPRLMRDVAIEHQAIYAQLNTLAAQA